MKIVKKFTINIIAIIIIIFSILTVYLISQQKNSAEERLNEKMEQDMIVFNLITSNALWNYDEGAFNTNNKAFLKEKEIIKIVLKDTEGKIISEAEKKNVNNEAKKLVKEIVLNKNGKIFGKAEITYTMEYIEKELKMAVINSIMIIVFSAIFLGIVIIIITLRSIIKPIEKMVEYSKEVAAGNIEKRIDIKSKDEIGALAENINIMVNELDKYTKEMDQKVKERTQELQQKNDTIMESLDYARRVQYSIIPNIPQKLKFSVENSFSIWRPRDQVGGDIFWCMGDENHSMVVIADCTGHGVPGALTSMVLSSILDSVSRDFGHENPALIMGAINTRLKETFGQDRKSEINDGADVAILYVDKVNKKMVFCGAKLSMFIVKDDATNIVKGSKCSVGYSDNENGKYENVEVDYIENGVYYFTTDGYLDQNSEKNRGGIGKKGFVSLIESIYKLPMEEQRTIIERDINNKLSNVIQRDDITVIGLKFAQ